MSREAELRAAIRANPDDDGPRLVYADLLAERDDPRGELIQLQLATDDDPDRDAREKRLLARFGTMWARQAGVASGAEVGYRRGFPYALIGPINALLASREALQREPITDLAITGIAGNAGGLTQLAQLPELAQIRWLRLQGALYGVQAHSMIPLWRSDELSSLATLEIAGNLVDDVRAPFLANASWFGQLDRLALSSINLAPEMTSRLIERLPKLRALDVRHCRLGEDVAIRLALTSAPLRQLWLEGCAISAAGANTIFGSRLALERLAIGGDQLSGTVATLAEARPRALRTLNLWSDRLTPRDAIAIAEGPFGQLVELSLATNEIGAAGAKALAASTTLRSLTTLYVTANLIGVAGIEALAHRTGLPRLAKLGAFATVFEEPWVETRERFAHEPTLQLI